MPRSASPHGAMKRRRLARRGLLYAMHGYMEHGREQSLEKLIDSFMYSFGF